uniref:Uncharacterized protein n=1 Tax=Megaviridae environmental sample TaxID=1737588 RepID=A0A5J6VIG2_9VIRU|nr:MAG: hypothetical protein [Megaviridae environmental sample]
MGFTLSKEQRLVKNCESAIKLVIVYTYTKECMEGFPGYNPDTVYISEAFTELFENGRKFNRNHQQVCLIIENIMNDTIEQDFQTRMENMTRFIEKNPEISTYAYILELENTKKKVVVSLREFMNKRKKN